MLECIDSKILVAEQPMFGDLVLNSEHGDSIEEKWQLNVAYILMKR